MAVSTLAISALFALGPFLGLVGVATVRAADPTATPIVFSKPQYLEWWDQHATYNGPVIDHVYQLYPVAPAADGSLSVPDGSGGVFHYRARLVAGPFTSDDALCPVMRQLGIEYLDVWPPGDYSPEVTCERFAAPSPSDDGSGSASPAASPAPNGSWDGGAGIAASGSTGSGGAGDPDPISMHLAEGLIGALLFGGGVAGFARAIGLRHDPPEAPEPPDGGRQNANQPPPDPCQDQWLEYQDASGGVRAIDSALQSLRSAVAFLDQRIAWLANITMGMGIGVDLAMTVSGGLAAAAEEAGIRAGGILARRFLTAETLFAKAVEGATRELIKTFGESLAEETAEVGWKLEDVVRSAMAESAGGGKGVAEEALKEAIRHSIEKAGAPVDAGLAATRQIRIPGPSRPMGFDPGATRQIRIRPSPNATVKIVRGAREAEGLQALAGPIAESVVQGLNAYQGARHAWEVKERVEALREQRDRLLDAIAEREVDRESAMERAQDAMARLTHCRTINAPGWTP